MSFESPQMLWLLLSVPLLAWSWWRLAGQRSQLALRYPGLLPAADRGAESNREAWLRMLPVALMLAAITVAIVGIARPRASVVLPSQQQTILLAIDVSLSMRARDVEPNRMTAAKAAARAFIEEVPPAVKVGIVAFAGTATLVQRPTLNREDLLAAVDRLEMQRGTATGSALVLALATLFPDQGIDLSAMLFGNNRGSNAGSATEASKGAAKAAKPVEPGSYTSAAIILLSDGRRTTGVDPVMAARMAAERGVRVYTVGVGTVAGGEVDFGGMSMYMKLDEEALKMMALVTEGEYKYAGTAADLRKVYQGLGSRLGLERRSTEISFAMAGLAALLALAGAALSLWRTGRIL